jgi:hypothetical protein
MSSLISRVKSELLNPVAIYNFLDAATKSLTIDNQLGGLTGLYDLAESLRGIPSNKIAFFTIPNYPRSEVVPSDTANVLWTQPEDNEIFASFRDDVPASSTLFGQGSSPATAAQQTAPANGTATANGSAPLAAGSTPVASPSSTPSATTSTSAPASSKPTPTSSPAARPVTIQARTANQSICAG